MVVSFSFGVFWLAPIFALLMIDALIFSPSSVASWLEESPTKPPTKISSSPFSVAFTFPAKLQPNTLVFTEWPTIAPNPPIVWSPSLII